MANPSAPDPHLNHWADQAAERTLRAHPEALSGKGDGSQGKPESIAVAAGITPSGVVHVGNFREVITVDLVARALADRGVPVRFIYSWDDFDVMRKVPKDAPQQEMLHQNLRRSIADVPDPWGEHDSYASHHIAAFEQSLAPLGIAPEFIRQHQRYRAGAYAEGIHEALANADRIREILNDARRAHGARRLLADDWLPLAGFCDACGKDDLRFAWDGEWSVHYDCGQCGHAHDVDLRKGGNLKLPWRVDWPMRWAQERVAFEPGGKDHSSAGGSYDTAKRIVAEIYGWSAPQYVGYDFVSVKGQGGKISSSKGGVVTVADCLEVYEPEVLRWLFASYRPNTEFQISFDLDVVKLYEDHDRAFRLAHEADDGGRNDKKRQAARRTMQLASVDHHHIEPGTPAPFLPGFRHLSVNLQIFDGDIERTRAVYAGEAELADPEVRRRFDQRARCVWSWIEQYAPEDFRYRIRAEPVGRVVEGESRMALQRVVAVLEQDPEADDATLGEHFKALAGELTTPLKEIYPLFYDLLLDRDRGPKLSTLLATMGAARALPLLKASLQEA
ncbi:lysine--tRNA ligase [Paraliomyxa miuraensis]|uniref:lysine--tRNA ligase n=1 Tax=Paraliomyxa miuraensis TaxID=376150 RepID=UPI00225AB381|nr:lysine--tRNA ligase [Paraliomyxa miuraensis]MCX4244876.1 lysine--tRNA ligase [Paraliomyxa miuraensis]